LKQRAGAQEQHSAQDAERGHPLSKAPASKLARHEGGEDHKYRSHDGGQNADRGKRVIEKRMRQVGENGDGGREIHSPKAKVLAHGEVEKLVAMHAVRSDRQYEEVQRELRRGEGTDDSRRKWRTCRREQIALCTV
jgi:hypothetical protein